MTKQYDMWLNKHMAAKLANPFFSKMREIFRLHRIWISKDLSMASKVGEDFQRLPKIAKDFSTTCLPKTTEDVEKFSTTLKQGQWFQEDSQPILSIIMKIFFLPKK